METIVKAVTPEVLKELEARQPLHKNIHEDGSNSEQKELAEKKSKAADFLKALEKGDRAVMKDLSSGSSGNGADLVPTYVSDQVITVAQKYGLARKYAMKWPMAGIDVNVPSFSTVVATRSSSDIASLPATSPTTGAVQLRAKTVSVIVPISRVLLQEATANVVDVITLLAGRAIAQLEDQWMFLGKASGEGVFQSATVPVKTMSSGNVLYNQLTAENLLDVLDLVDENFVGPSMRWAFSLSVLNALRRLRANVSTDKQGFLLEPVCGMVPATLWDIPFDTTAVMPKVSDGSQTSKKFLALVDYDNVIYGDRMEYSMELSNEATITSSDGVTQIPLWQQNMVGIKIWGLVDIELSNSASAFGVLKTAAS
jgi:HK97 family phage major capsid protein